jgi:hypothetical protein
MKKLLFLPILFVSLSVNAQHYVRTKHNFGVTASYNFIDETRLKKSFHGIEQGNSFAVGITHEWKNFLYPELFFVQHSGKFPVNTESPLAAASYKMNGIGMGLTAKIDLFTFDNKKKNGYCFGRVLNLIFGSDYVYNLPMNSVDGLVKTRNEFDAKAGLGMYSVWGGSAKKHMAWTIHWEGYYKYGVTPFMDIKNYAADGSALSFAHSSVGVTLRVMYFKTYKFSDM